MTLLPMPPTVKSQGNTVLGVLTTAPAVPGAPTKAELNAGKFITCHIYGNFSAQPSQNVGEAPRKMCAKSIPQEFGNVTYPVNDLQYSYVPQDLGTPGSPGNEAFEAFAEGTEVYLFEGPGIDGESPSLATGDVINLYHVEAGLQRRGMTGDGEFDQFSVTQGFVMVDGSAPQYDYVVPAA